MPEKERPATEAVLRATCIYVFVEKHDTFVRNGHDLLIEVPIQFYQAALGAEIEVPTLGKAKFTVLPEHRLTACSG